jgi:hypothetical protein
MESVFQIGKEIPVTGKSGIVSFGERLRLSIRWNIIPF